MRIIALFAIFATSFAYAQQAAVRPFAPELFSPKTSGAVCGFSPDGKTIYFIREDTVADKLFVYQADKKETKWTNAKLLPFSGRHNDMGGRLSPDGKSFYFTSDRSGGSTKENDQWNIWVSHFNDGSWSEPEPLSVINNKGSECCPVPFGEKNIIFSGDRGAPQEWWIYSWDGAGETLLNTLTEKSGWQWPSSYVASEQLMLFNSMKRNDSKGMDDVYVSFYANNQWTQPINIGAPINTNVYEDGAVLSADEKYLIFNRHETGSTPSLVMYTEWEPILKRLKSLKKSGRD